jgi:hypothetical protein
VTTISCVGCGRTQRLRKNKVVPSDGYLCGVGYGKQNPKFALPRNVEGGQPSGNHSDLYVRGSDGEGTLGSGARLHGFWADCPS